MPIITLTTDFGTRDHYSSALKAKIISKGRENTIVDISHHIESMNIGHAAHVLKAVFRDFPAGTVHLVAVATCNLSGVQMIAAEIEQFFFVLPDNGLITLLSASEINAVLIKHNNTTMANTFPEYEILAEAAVTLAKEKNIHKVGTETVNPKKLISRICKVTKNTIEGYVVHADSYGNCITNIDRNTFEKTSNGRKYTISIGRNFIDKIHSQYHEAAQGGEMGLIFNAQNMLEVYIYSGSARQLLNLKSDIIDGTMVRISFFPEL